jgi:hypothetical protein
LKGTMLPSPSPKAAADNSAHEPSIFYQPPPSNSEPRVVYYSVFFDNDVYKGNRPSVIMEACEAQQFTPVDLSRLRLRHRRSPYQSANSNWCRAGFRQPAAVSRACGKRGGDVRPDFNWDRMPVS